jgi:hypothetical protein
LASKEEPHPNIFIDEFPFGEDGFTSEEVAEISQKLSSWSFLWIACRSEGDNPDSAFVDSGKIEHLNFSRQGVRFLRSLDIAVLL